MTSNRSLSEMVERLWGLHRRGLSYASDKPAVNLLLADLSEGIADAARALALSSQAQSDDVVERVARALYFSEWAPGYEPPCTWESVCAEEAEIAEAWRVSARAAIAAIPPAGGVEEPTQAMIEAGDKILGEYWALRCAARQGAVRRIYRAMQAALGSAKP